MGKVKNRQYVMVDVEADGQAPGLYSMTELAVVIVEPGLGRAFYAQLRPLPGASWDPTALAVCGRTREEVMGFPPAERGMARLGAWLARELTAAGTRPMLVSDNNGFDWQFVNWYFWNFLGRNPFGHSSTNLGSLYKGLAGDCWRSFRELSVPTPHTHDPRDDARGHAEAMLRMRDEMGLKF